MPYIEPDYDANGYIPSYKSGTHREIEAKLK